MKKRKKRKPWYQKHHEQCEGFRRAFGAKQGDGLKLLAQMKQGNEVERAFAEVLEKTARSSFMSADAFDALIGAYAQNPALALLMGRLREDPEKPH